MSREQNTYLSKLFDACCISQGTLGWRTCHSFTGGSQLCFQQILNQDIETHYKKFKAKLRLQEWKGAFSKTSCHDEPSLNVFLNPTRPTLVQTIWSQNGNKTDRSIRMFILNSWFWWEFRDFAVVVRSSFLSLDLPLGIHKCPSMQWQLGLFVHTGKAAFDKYKTLSLSHFGIFWDFPKQMSWKIHWERT